MDNDETLVLAATIDPEDLERLKRLMHRTLSTRSEVVKYALIFYEVMLDAFAEGASKYFYTTNWLENM